MDTPPLTKPDLTEVELRAKAMAAKSTEDWLELYSEVTMASIFRANSTDAGVAIGNILEVIREWKSDWKKAAIELKAIGLNALEDVELDDVPRINPQTGKYVIKPEGMKVYWFERGEKPVVFKGRQALSVYHFFSWFVSFKDTLGDPKARLGGSLDITKHADIIIGGGR